MAMSNSKNMAMFSTFVITDERVGVCFKENMFYPYRSKHLLRHGVCGMFGGESIYLWFQIAHGLNQTSATRAY